MNNFSERLQRIRTNSIGRDLTLKEISDTVGTDGHYLFILLLTLPFLQPIPVPGFSTIFGITIVFISVGAYRNRPPRVPRRWAEKKIASSSVSKIVDGVNHLYQKIQFLIRPRFPFLFQGPFRAANTLFLGTNACLLALPLPIPFSNAIPAWMILFQSIAHLEKDGVFILLSYLQTIFCLVYFGFIAKGIEFGIDRLLWN